jgi:3-oxoadipate enol-lactonase
MPFAQTASGSLHYEVCDIAPEWVSDPQTIVFHHGIGANLHIFAHWLPVLATRYRLVRFDMRGFGQSAVPPKDYPWSFDGLVDDLLTVADATGTGRFHLVGESIGGTAVLACALRHPERVRSACLSNAAARGGLVGNVKGWREIVAQSGQNGWARQMMEWRFFPDGVDAARRGWFENVHATCSIEATFGLADLLLRSDLTPRLGEIKIPTLLLSPEASPFIPMEVMASMRSAIPEAELQVFAHSKHGLPLTHGAECARVLLDFLQRHSR